MDRRGLHDLVDTWTEAQEAFRTQAYSPIKLVVENNLPTLEISSTDEYSSVIFKFAVYSFVLRLEADEHFQPVVVCRRKRDLAEAAEVGAVVCSVTLAQLSQEYHRNHKGDPLDRALDLFLLLTGLDKVESPPGGET